LKKELQMEIEHMHFVFTKLP